LRHSPEQCSANVLSRYPPTVPISMAKSPIRHTKTNTNPTGMGRSPTIKEPGTVRIALHAVALDVTAARAAAPGVVAPASGHAATSSNGGSWSANTMSAASWVSSNSIDHILMPNRSGRRIRSAPHTRNRDHHSHMDMVACGTFHVPARMITMGTVNNRIVSAEADFQRDRQYMPPPFILAVASFGVSQGNGGLAERSRLLTGNAPRAQYFRVAARMT